MNILGFHLLKWVFFSSLCSHNSNKIDLCIFTTLSMFDGYNSCWMEQKRAKWNASFILCMQAYSNNGCEFFFFSISFRFLTHVFLDGTHQFSHQNICTSLRFATLQPHKEYRRKYHPNPKKSFIKNTFFYRLQCQLLMSTKCRMWKLSYAIIKRRKRNRNTEPRDRDGAHFLWRL